MKIGSFFRRLFQMSISNNIRMVFIVSTLLTLFVSAVSLYSWYEQSIQVRFSINDYFPRVRSAFNIEKNLGAMEARLNDYISTDDKDTQEKYHKQIIGYIDEIERVSKQTPIATKQKLNVILHESRQLLEDISNALYIVSINREKIAEISRRIDDLHDDFTTEVGSVMQEVTWQQRALLEQAALRRNDNTVLYKQLQEVQREQIYLYQLTQTETQVVTFLRAWLDENDHSVSDLDENSDHLLYLENLKKIATESTAILKVYPGTVSLRQNIDELMDVGLNDDQVPGVIRNYVASKQALSMLKKMKSEKLLHLRGIIEAQLSRSHQQLLQFSQHLERVILISGGLILAAMILALILLWGLNHFFINPCLVRRFDALNQSVRQIKYHRHRVVIPVYGKDELGRMAHLLRKTLQQLMRQQTRLEQEVTERKNIERCLRETQEELVQSAKLAVVGQTMTTLAHEINQPLNALSMYLYTAKLALENNQPDQVPQLLTKASGVTGRIDGIIRLLRQFTRKTSGSDIPRLPISLRQSFLSAWELLSLTPKANVATLELPDDDLIVDGDDTRIQQVLVNLLVNAFEACQEEPRISVYWQAEGKHSTVMVCDNGSGWSSSLFPDLLRPFTTSKNIGLGLGLSVSASLMTQLDGELYLASTLGRNACVVLQFNKEGHDAD